MNPLCHRKPDPGINGCFAHQPHSCVILSKQSAPKDLSRKILRLRFTPLRMTNSWNCYVNRVPTCCLSG